MSAVLDNQIDTVAQQGATRGGAAQSRTAHAYGDVLTLNLAPLRFSAPNFAAGRLPYVDEAQYRALREGHRGTHAFRFDARENCLFNISLSRDSAALGEPCQLETQGHLLLLGKAVHQFLFSWLSKSRTIIRPSRPLQCWGNRKAALLSAAIKELGLEPRQGLDVLVRHSFDTRVLDAPGNDAAPFLALLLEVSTSNELDISADALLAAGMDPLGRYVCMRPEASEEGVLPRLETLGRVVGVADGQFQLNDFSGDEFVSTKSVVLEPRQENLEILVRLFYPQRAETILEGLKRRRAPYASAKGKFQAISSVHQGVAERLEQADFGGLQVRMSPLLQRGDTLFPHGISTARPGFLFGAQGRETSPYPDVGVKTHGPYKYMQHERNEPLIAIICESRYRGRIDIFAKMLRDGFDENAWRDAMRNRQKPVDNPFQGGLVGKFRLGRVQLEFEEVTDPSPASYRAAIARLLARVPENPDLALVQIRGSFKALRNEDNPYFASKADFMSVGIPVQSLLIETAEMPAANLAYTVNNLALAAYSKLGGTPFVISTRMPATHELVVGLGYTEVGEGRFGPKSRYVGITTVFQGDGRYLVWGQTREVEFAHYADALLASLRTTIESVRKENNWQPKDRVRLIFHVYKPLKYSEIDAIRALVKELVAGQHQVEFAFLDISRHHDFVLFDPGQKGVPYFVPEKGVKGIGVPERGICHQLSDRSALLQLVGPKEVKTGSQGLPRPLLLTLHPESDFVDLTYLARQVFHFSYLSWRSYFPAIEPVSITYSRLIANALGNLRSVPGWNSASLTVGTLRNRMWFL